MTTGLKSLTKTVTKKAFLALGTDTRHVMRQTSSGPTRLDPPPIFDDPLEALHFARGGMPAAFHCPIDDCCLLNGLRFGPTGWNPFSATVSQILGGQINAYPGSVLEKYYQIWRPSRASEAVIGLPESSSSLGGYPAFLYSAVPWRSLEPAQIRVEVENWYRNDSLQHAVLGLRIEKDGYKTHGPVQPCLGNIEFLRLEKIAFSIGTAGFDRSCGDVSVWMLRRGHDVRFVNRGGLHRMAAMDALGRRTIPARFQQLGIFDLADIDYWPQVRKGTWTRREAIRYFNHIFDFDVRAWAQGHGLTCEVNALKNLRDYTERQFIPLATTRSLF